jgi:methylated-DNA-[protein]-cysteine S-methyltransferase
MNDLERLLAGSPDATEPAMERLRTLLSRRAEQHDLLDIAYRTLDTPVGNLLLAATPAGLLRVAYPGEDHDAVLAALADRVSPRILRAPARLDGAARQLEEYFAQDRRGFELPLDLQLAHGFRRTVLEHLRRVEYGHTISYAVLAAEVGNPRAVRAVGTACATNPLPLILPCHRVVRSDGTTGAYVGGHDVKQTLLNLEHADQADHDGTDGPAATRRA